MDITRIQEGDIVFHRRSGKMGVVQDVSHGCSIVRESVDDPFYPEVEQPITTWITRACAKYLGLYFSGPSEYKSFSSRNCDLVHVLPTFKNKFE